MILVDTHIWVWWVTGDSRLPVRTREFVELNESTGLGLSVISCWEVAKKFSVGKLTLDRDIAEWMRGAIEYPGVRTVPLTPEVALESTRLPGAFHRDPADQIIVATARLLDVPLLTMDDQILSYDHVRFAVVPG